MHDPMNVKSVRHAAHLTHVLNVYTATSKTADLWLWFAPAHTLLFRSLNSVWTFLRFVHTQSHKWDGRTR